ncbi:MAG: Ger(x)C family spore germination protein, partial [Firmicutes bacterium]|nr:Ger(x)C family spore germination protein [Bacillota bacterium]
MGQVQGKARSLEAVWICLLLLVLPMTVGGCTDAREIEDVGFIMGLGIDRAEAGAGRASEELRVWVQVVIPSSKPEEAQHGTAWLGSAVGGSVWQALRALETRSGRSLFLGHVRTVVLGEEFARAGIAEALDIFARDAQFRYKSLLVVTPDSVEELLSVESPQEPMASTLINSIMRNADRPSTAPMSTFLRVITSLEQAGDQPLLARVSLPDQKVGQGGEAAGAPAGGGPTAPPRASQGQGGAEGGGPSEAGPGGQTQQKPQELEVCGAAVFHGDKMIGWLSSEETAMALMLRNELQRYSFTAPAPGDAPGTIGVFVMDATSSIRTGRIEPDLSRVPVHITVKGHVEIREIKSPREFLTPEEVQRINDELSKKMQDELTHCVQLAQREFGTDFLGVGEAFRKRLSVRRWE